jgi:hypothetical protein
MEAYHVMCAMESRLIREKVITGPSLTPEQLSPEFIRTHVKPEDFDYQTEVSFNFSLLTVSRRYKS